MNHWAAMNGLPACELTYLRGLANLLPDYLPLAVLIVFDRL